MARFSVEVRGGGDEYYVVAVLPSGGFTRGPMPEEEAIIVAVDLRKELGELHPPWYERLLKKFKGEVKARVQRTPKCSRHPQWQPERVKDKWVCGFCRKELEK